MILEFPKYTQKPIFSRNFNFIDILSFKTRIPFANRNFRAPSIINCAPHLFGFFFSLAFSIQRKEKSMKEKNSNWNFNVAKFSCNPVVKITFSRNDATTDILQAFINYLKVQIFTILSERSLEMWMCHQIKTIFDFFRNVASL